MGTSIPPTPLLINNNSNPLSNQISNANSLVTSGINFDNIKAVQLAAVSQLQSQISRRINPVITVSLNINNNNNNSNSIQHHVIQQLLQKEIRAVALHVNNSSSSSQQIIRNPMHIGNNSNNPDRRNNCQKFNVINAGTNVNNIMRSSQITNSNSSANSNTTSNNGSARTSGGFFNGFFNPATIIDAKTARDLGIGILPENSPILGERYVILNQISGSSFYNCLDIKTSDTLICKAIGDSYSKIISAYFKLDGEPHIKPFHKILQLTNQTYLLLAPSQYGDLHSYVRERKRLSETEARHLFRQICKTVKKCHEEGIILRDLKLRKFVFSDKERKTLQFESLEDAVVLEDPDEDILKEKIGCPAYVAPEILKPNSDFSGKAADLWSLGVILYTMLVGRYPFNDPEHSSLFAKIARCTFLVPEYVSPKARCLIKSLLQKVPKHRLTSDDLLDHPWFNNESQTQSSFSSFAFTNSTKQLDDDHQVPEMPDTMEFT